MKYTMWGQGAPKVQTDRQTDLRILDVYVLFEELFPQTDGTSESLVESSLMSRRRYIQSRYFSLRIAARDSSHSPTPICKGTQAMGLCNIQYIIHSYTVYNTQ